MIHPFLKKMWFVNQPIKTWWLDFQGMPTCHLKWPKFWIPSILSRTPPFGREVAPKIWGKASIDLFYTNMGIWWPMEYDKISTTVTCLQHLDVCMISDACMPSVWDVRKCRLLLQPQVLLKAACLSLRQNLSFSLFDSSQHCEYRMLWSEFLSWKRIMSLAIPFSCNILQRCCP